MSYYSRWSYFSNFMENAPFSFQIASSNEAMGSVAVLQQPTCSAPNAVVQATPMSGYQFDHWSNGVTQNPYFLTVTGDTLLTAIFSALQDDTVYIHDTITVPYYIHDTVFVPLWGHDTLFVHDTVTLYDTVGADLTYHSVELMSRDITRGMVAGKGVFPEGTVVEIAAVPIRGNKFVQWSDGSTEQIRTVTMNEDISLTASFESLGRVGIDEITETSFVVTTEQGAIVVIKCLSVSRMANFAVLIISTRLSIQPQVVSILSNVRLQPISSIVVSLMMVNALLPLLSIQEITIMLSLLLVTMAMNATSFIQTMLCQIIRHLYQNKVICL